jgi:hypothetical protein
MSQTPRRPQRLHGGTVAVWRPLPLPSISRLRARRGRPLRPLAGKSWAARPAASAPGRDLGESSVAASLRPRSSGPVAVKRWGAGLPDSNRLMPCGNTIQCDAPFPCAFARRPW